MFQWDKHICSFKSLSDAEGLNFIYSLTYLPVPLVPAGWQESTGATRSAILTNKIKWDV